MPKRRKPPSPHDLPKIKRRYPNGQHRREQAERDARKTAIDARLRHTGRSASRENQRAILDPINADEAGRCLAALCHPREAFDLHGIWLDLTAARRTYRVRYLGFAGTPQSSAIAMMPERLEAEPDRDTDLRTDQERAEAAIRVWAIWRGRIAAIDPPWLAAAVVGLADGIIPLRTLWRDGMATSAGARFVTAMRSLAQGLT